MPHPQLPSSTSEPSFHDRARCYIYDRTLTAASTSRLYRLIHALPDNSFVLLIGIGTGSALAAHSHLLLAKRITVLAVEADSSYFTVCRERLQEAGLSSAITLVQADISNYDYRGDRLFNHVCFSSCFGRLSGLASILAKVVDWLVDREIGRVYFAEEFELTKNRWREWLKPTVGTVTGVALGEVCYEADFEETLRDGGLAVEAWEVVDDDGRIEGVREGRIVASRSRLYVPRETETAV